VIHAAEELGRSGALAYYGGALVAATVTKDVDLSVLVAHENDRGLSHRRRDEISCLRDLRFMTDIDPRPTVDAGDLILENLWVAIDVPMDAVASNELSIVD